MGDSIIEEVTTTATRLPPWWLIALVGVFLVLAVRR